MATEQNFKTITINKGSLSDALDKINQDADNRYFPMNVIQTSDGRDAILMSQGVNVLQGRHPDIGNVHFVKTDSTTDELYTLIDLDDLVNYPHHNDSALDIEAMRVVIDANSNADYQIQIGFLRDVNATDGRLVEVFRTSAENSDGATTHTGRVFAGGGGILTPEKWLSSLNPASTDLANTELLASTLDIDTEDITPADGDLVMRIIRGNTDQLSVAVTITYRTI